MTFEATPAVKRNALVFGGQGVRIVTRDATELFAALAIANASTHLLNLADEVIAYLERTGKVR